MSRRAMEGTCLLALVRQAIPLCQEAQRQCPRKGPGRKPQVPDWVLAVLIVVAILKMRKSKSSQYRFLLTHREGLLKALGTDRFPARSTYFDRYRRAWQLYEVAIRLAGQLAVQEGFTQARCVAVDKSVIDARGPLWNKRHVARGRLPSGVDLDATWTRSAHDGWVMGYGYEVVVTAEKRGAVWPLLASAGAASWQPNRTFPSKIPHLPSSTRYVVADAGYDSNAMAEAVEQSAAGRPTGRRLLCPHVRKAHRPATRVWKATRKRKHHRKLRDARKAFMARPFARRLLRRRGCKVEPFNDWLKSRFELHHKVWHRGLDNNRTQILGAMFGYQLLLHVNHRYGNTNGRIQWILDSL